MISLTATQQDGGIHPSGSDMGELINEQQPRVKFQLERLGEPTTRLSLETPELQASSAHWHASGHQPTKIVNK